MPIAPVQVLDEHGYWLVHDAEGVYRRAVAARAAACARDYATAEVALYEALRIAGQIELRVRDALRSVQVCAAEAQERPQEGRV